MTVAEKLLELADAIQHPRDEVLCFDDVPYYLIGMSSLAMRLRANPDVAFRAIMENWSRADIIRELY